MKVKILCCVLLACFMNFFASPVSSAYSQEEESLRNTALSYLADPQFSDWSFLEKLSGTKSKLELISYRDGHIYLSIGGDELTRDVINSLCINPKKIEFAKTASGKFQRNHGEIGHLELGGYKYYKEGRYLFRIPIDNFRIDFSKKMRYRFDGLFYDISLRELDAFIANKSIYGGYLEVLKKRTGNTVTTFANHGALVAQKEASLKRLVERITKGSPTKEKKIQSLLDFVTRQIEYSQEEALASVETLKRANEVLMTGMSDCSGKVVLFASLLEQLDIEYRLLYMGMGEDVGHIAVAVTGNFPSRNDLTFSIGEKKYYLAETTARGFVIGQSLLTKNIEVSDISYIQKPGKNSRVYNARTGKPVEFF